MTIRITPERILHTLVAVVFIVWLIVWATGCKTDVPVDVTGVDLSKTATTTTTVPVSTGDVGGDLTVITQAGATPWTIAGLVGVLWAFQARRQGTATGALDRVVTAINEHYSFAKENASPDNHEMRHHAGALKMLRNTIERRGRIGAGPGYGRNVCDGDERFLRSRLARLKK